MKKLLKIIVFALALVSGLMQVSDVSARGGGHGGGGHGYHGGGHGYHGGRGYGHGGWHHGWGYRGGYGGWGSGAWGWGWGPYGYGYSPAYDPYYYDNPGVGIGLAIGSALA